MKIIITYAAYRLPYASAYADEMEYTEVEWWTTWKGFCREWPILRDECGYKLVSIQWKNWK